MITQNKNDIDPDSEYNIRSINNPPINATECNVDSRSTLLVNILKGGNVLENQITTRHCIQCDVKQRNNSK